MRVLSWTLLLGGCAVSRGDDTGGDDFGGQAGEDTGLECGAVETTTYAPGAVTPLGETVEALGTAAQTAQTLALTWTDGGAADLQVTIDYQGAGGVWTNAVTCDERLEIDVAVTGTSEGLTFTSGGLLRLTAAERLLYVGLAPDAVSGSWDPPATAARVEVHLDLDTGSGAVKVVHADGTVEQVATLSASAAR